MLIYATAYGIRDVCSGFFNYKVKPFSLKIGHEVFFNDTVPTSATVDSNLGSEHTSSLGKPGANVGQPITFFSCSREAILIVVTLYGTRMAEIHMNLIVRWSDYFLCCLTL